MVTAHSRPDLLSDLAEFLATRPTADQILSWHPSEAVQQRFEDLVAKQKEGNISLDESQELERALNLEILVQLLKARIDSGVVRRK